MIIEDGTRDHLQAEHRRWISILWSEKGEEIERARRDSRSRSEGSKPETRRAVAVCGADGGVLVLIRQFYGLLNTGPATGTPIPSQVN